MTGDPGTDVFVLRPATDFHARAALLFYAIEIQHKNPALATYLRAWMALLHETDMLAGRLTKPEIPDWMYEQQEAGDTVWMKPKNKPE